MPVAIPSAAAQAVAAKYEDIATKYNDHQEDVDLLQNAALEKVLPEVLTEVGLQDDHQASKHIRQFLKDRGKCDNKSKKKKGERNIHVNRILIVPCFYLLSF